MSTERFNCRNQRRSEQAVIVVVVVVVVVIVIVVAASRNIRGRVEFSASTTCPGHSVTYLRKICELLLIPVQL